MRIVFYGTPDFAVESLKALVGTGKQVVGVVTAPDKPAGRGYKLKKSAVKQFAEKHHLKVLQPTNLKSGAFHDELKALDPEMQVVVAFRMLPEKVWAYPKHGTFNLHASLLPKYRGAAPINWAIMNGEVETGVTTFLLQHEIDTGSILFSEHTVIGENETAGELHDRLMAMGAKLVMKTVDAIESGNVKPIPQSLLIEKGLKAGPAPKLNKQMCEVDVTRSAQEVHDKIRGLSPFPGAFIKIQHGGQTRVLKLYRSQIVEEKQSNPAPCLVAEDEQLYLVVPDGKLKLAEVQLEGKKRLSAPEFLRGFDPTGWKLVPSKKNQV